VGSVEGALLGLVDGTIEGGKLVGRVERTVLGATEGLVDNVIEGSRVGMAVGT